MNDKLQRVGFAFICLIVLSLTNSCNRSVSESDQPENSQSKISQPANNLDEQCKKVIKAINQSNTRIEAFLAEPPDIPLPSPLPLEPSPLPLETETTPSPDPPSNKGLNAWKARFQEMLQARLQNVQAVEISDPQLKNFQTQLVQTYKQQAVAENQPTQPIELPYIGDSKEKEEEIARKVKEDDRKREENGQRMQNATVKVSTADSDLKKYCGLE